MKHAKCTLSLALCLLLAACGPKPAEEPPAASTSEPPAVSEPGPDMSQPDVSAPDVSEPPEEEPLPSLTQADKDAAQEAALVYYQSTVFEVDSLTEIEPRQGEITFQVSCSKGGEKVDPDRTISLERQNGAWTVVSEGY